MIPPRPTAPLFPYTTLFRSICSLAAGMGQRPHLDYEIRCHAALTRPGMGCELDLINTRLNSSHARGSCVGFCFGKEARANHADAMDVTPAEGTVPGAGPCEL